MIFDHGIEQCVHTCMYTVCPRFGCHLDEEVALYISIRLGYERIG